MSDIAIKVENLSKLYRLGDIGTGTISHDLNRWWARIRGKEDPFAKVAVSNDRSQKNDTEYVWSLKDIDFEIKKGDAVGIIGRNGAGKSTLLKILSRVTGPTTGSVKINGRVASLLEVGTGFNPELTGRENIYMNGAILGMTRREITSRMEEIIEFSGVAGYIDTPVKRYSSGMYVRLAFAVAAHLEPEILIVDEVLAVGDAEFQKKCLGKMQDVNSNEGRTVLFVSHNMTAISKLCNKGIVLRNGGVIYNGGIASAIDLHLQENRNQSTHSKWELEDAPGNERVKLLEARISSAKPPLKINQPLELYFKFYSRQDQLMNLSLVLRNATGDVVFNALTTPKQLNESHYSSSLRIPPDILNDGNYAIDLYFVDSSIMKAIFIQNDILNFELGDVRDETQWIGKWTGVIRPKFEFEITYA